jgi:hypothetical protein
VAIKKNSSIAFWDAKLLQRRTRRSRSGEIARQMDKESSVLQEYDLKSFQRYVRDLRKANPQKVAVITEDNNIIKGELERFPRPIKTNRGEPSLFGTIIQPNFFCEKMSKQVSTSK